MENLDPGYRFWLEASEDGGVSWRLVTFAAPDVGVALVDAGAVLAQRGVPAGAVKRALSTLAQGRGLEREVECEGVMFRLERRPEGLARATTEDVLDVLRVVDEPLATVQVSDALDAVARGLGCAGVLHDRTPPLMLRLADAGLVVKASLADFKEVFGVEPPSEAELLERFPRAGRKSLRFSWWASVEAVKRWHG